MTSVIHFFLLAFLIATVLGGSQALSRALFARMIPQDRTSEFFGFYAVSERFATIFGPALFTISVARHGIEPRRRFSRSSACSSPARSC